MYKEEELSQELFQLERSLRKAIFGSKEFKQLKKKIEEQGLQMHVLLMVMAKSKSKKGGQTRKRKLGCKLSDKDKEFFENHGINWE